MKSSNPRSQKLPMLIATLSCLLLAQACGLDTEWKVGLRGQASVTDNSGTAAVELSGGRTAETWDQADLTLDHRLDFNIIKLTAGKAQDYQLSLTLDGSISRVGQHRLTAFEGYVDIPGDLHRSRKIVRITNKDWTATARVATTAFIDDPAGDEASPVQRAEGTLELTLVGPDNLRLVVEDGTFKLLVRQYTCVDECRGL